MHVHTIHILQVYIASVLFCFSSTRLRRVQGMLLEKGIDALLAILGKFLGYIPMYVYNGVTRKF